MKFLIATFFLIFSINLLAVGSCSKDYMKAQSITLNGYSHSEIEKIESFALAGDPLNGWKYLAGLGDEYAKIAFQVLNKSDDFKNKFYNKLISTHWVNVIGREKFKDYFLLVAKQHFFQYVQVVSTGQSPDSDQILLSYLAATKKYNLPELLVFDAAWELSPYQKIASWQKLNHLSGTRLIFPSTVCLQSKSSVATKLVYKDLILSGLGMFSEL